MLNRKHWAIGILLTLAPTAHAIEPANIDLYCKYTHTKDKSGEESPWNIDPSFNIRIASDGSTVITSTSRWLDCKEWRGKSDQHSIQGYCRKVDSLAEKEEQIEISRIDGKLRHTFIGAAKPGFESYEFVGHGTCRKVETKF